MHPSDLMEPEWPTAVLRLAQRLGRAGCLHPLIEESGHGPKSNQSLLEHAFAYPGTGPSRERRIGGRLTPEEKTLKSTTSASKVKWAYSVDTS